jgi:hypothetical protein
LMIAIVIRVRSNLKLVLICICFKTKGVEYFFMYLLNICTSFKNYLFHSFAYLAICIIFPFSV